ncbi:MAG: peptidase, partial [Deltaproteobacteria bacterium]|nr:peptidase [Deltaproteobacteria bacterium]
MQTYLQSFISLFSVNMGHRTGDRILIFSDLLRSDEQPTASDQDRRNRLHATAQELANFAQARFGNTTFIDFLSTQASG